MIHHSARVGGPPEDRAFIADPTLPTYAPIIGDDVWINAYVTVDAGTARATKIGRGSILLAHSHVGHDVQVGEDCQLATGCVIGGHARLGDRVKVGLNATVLPFRSVGDGAVIGAGSVVTHDVPAGATVAGNPARLIEANPVPFTQRAA